MSRFAAMSSENRAVDSAFSPFSEDCDHPEAARTDHDSGGQVGRPSFYCTGCNRLVFYGER